MRKKVGIKRIGITFNGTFVFLVGLIFIDLFGFNPERMEGSVVTKNLVLPYVSLNITVAMLGLSIIACTMIFIGRRNRRESKDLLILLMRIPLYLIPILYIQGDFKIGVAYAVVQCALAYYIGTNNTSKYSFILNFLILLILGLSIEVFAVVLLNKLSIFSPDIKWYMVIPIGKSNYITCVILPIYVAAVEFYRNKWKPIISLGFSLFIFIALLSTGSKFSLVLFVGYWAVRLVILIWRNQTSAKDKFIRNLMLGFVCIGGIISIFVTHSTQVNIILNRFGTSTLFSNRLKVYSETANLILQHFIFGRSAYSYHVFDAAKAHNWILESLVQTGIVGTLIYGYLICSCAMKISRIHQKNIKRSMIAYIAIYLIQGMVEPNLFGTLSDALFWLMMGVAFSIYRNRGEIHSE